MIGAYFLDAGRDVSAVQAYVLPMFDTVVEQALQAGINAKSRLQELTQKRFGEVPVYVLLRSEGPDHAKEFVVEVRINQQPYGCGRGHSKKDAEKMAAQLTLERLSRP